MEEVAAIARCSQRTVARAIARGELVTTKERGLVLTKSAEGKRWADQRQTARRRRQPAAASKLLARVCHAELLAVREAF